MQTIPERFPRVFHELKSALMHSAQLLNAAGRTEEALRLSAIPDVLRDGFNEQALTTLETLGRKSAKWPNGDLWTYRFAKYGEAIKVLKDAPAEQPMRQAAE